MTDYDVTIWTLRYGAYDDDGLARVIADGGEHGDLAASLYDKRIETKSGVELGRIVAERGATDPLSLRIDRELQERMARGSLRPR